ncbi:Two-component system, sensory histidine kinase [Corynebacterium glyciniphilum AJ 3170]|uniref:Sensor histidine kinase MtrB n=1 Tax=Corynebacterium glyciniphilum AJ 3170 TaxID=1404245 RepID=X5DJU2_9CORY|nr:MtrAB system histidine kinase MtrB [Corynebacterium glyciniphilum]AHW63363.1 Two-component system, sensory histidine kinase [Corynebacterium glyciniphilum AJ 3170]
MASRSGDERQDETGTGAGRRHGGRLGRPALPVVRDGDRRRSRNQNGRAVDTDSDPRRAPRGELGDIGFLDGLRIFLRRPVRFARKFSEKLAQRWRTSIQLRVIGSVFASSLLVIMALGFVLTSFVGQQLLDAKYNAATDEIDRARGIVEEQIRNTDSATSPQMRINNARAALSDRTAESEQGSTGTVYEPVIIASDLTGGDISSPENHPVPDSLRDFVRQGQVSVQYTTVESPGGTYKALVIGSPVASDIQGLELYLVMPLDNEESTMALMRGLLLAGAVVLMVLLVVIAWVFSQQLTVPVRTASRIAERFAAGHMRERMAVDGQDEVARLAISFNEMAENLSYQIRQLEEFGSLQQQFTSDVSHELRTPLTTVRMAADLIHANSEDLDPVTRRASELMNAELDRFEMLLGDLLEISRHDAGVANLSRELIDVRGVVKSTMGQLRALAEEVGCEIQLDLPDEPVMEEVDSRRVERILRNLLANAIDHSESRPVRVTMRRGAESLAVTVVDHGMGLKPGEADLVFNRFWRSDPSRERKTGGTGLGLAIAKEDAQLHGGRLEATGEPGLGACFRLTLPRKPGQEVRTSPLPLEVDRAEGAEVLELTGQSAGIPETMDEAADAADERQQDDAAVDASVEAASDGMSVATSEAESAADTVYTSEGVDGGEAGDSADGVVADGQDEMNDSAGGGDADGVVSDEPVDRFDSVDVTAGSVETFGVDLSAFEGLTEEELRTALQEAEDMDSAFDADSDPDDSRDGEEGDDDKS